MESEQGQLPSEKWIAASDALKVLHPHHRGVLHTKALLAELLKDGELQARSRRMWVSREKSISAAWRSRDEVETEEDCLVDQAVWERSRYWTEDLTLWRWPKNNFVVTRTKRPANRTILEGVEFSRSQSEALIPIKSRKGIGGSEIRPEDWTAIGVALVMMAHMGAFMPPGPPQLIKPTPYKNVTQFVTARMGLSGEAYGRTHTFDCLGPVYKYFCPDTAKGSQRTEPDSMK